MRWEKPFFKETLKYFHKRSIAPHHVKLLLAIYLIMYIFHWFFVKDPFNVMATTLFHLNLILIVIVLFWFLRSDTSIVPKKGLTKNKDTNLVGKILDIVES